MWRLKFHGVPILVVFVEGPIHEFQYPRNGNFLYELWKKILYPRILNPTNVSFFVQSTKIGTHENKAIHIYDRLCQNIQKREGPDSWFLSDCYINQSTESTDLDSMNIDIGLCCKWTWKWPVQARIAATELTQLQQ